MRKVLRVIPLFLFPVSYLLFAALYLFLGSIVIITLELLFQDINDSYMTVISFISATAYAAYLAYVVYYFFSTPVRMIDGEYSAPQTAAINLIIKGYTLIFEVLCCLGLLLSCMLGPWAIGGFAIMTLAFSVAFLVSCFFSLFCSIRMITEKVMSVPLIILMMVLCFIPVLDIVAAIFYCCYSCKKYPKRRSREIPDEEKKERKLIEHDKRRFSRKTVPLIVLPSLMIFAYGIYELITDIDIFYFAEILITFFAFCILFSVLCIRFVFKGKVNTKYACEANLIVKLFHNCVIFISFVVSAVLNIELTMYYVLFLSVISFVLSGLLSFACVSRLQHAGGVSFRAIIPLALFAFVPLADTFVSIIIMVQAANSEKAVSIIPTSEIIQQNIQEVK